MAPEVVATPAGGRESRAPVGPLVLRAPARRPARRDRIFRALAAVALWGAAVLPSLAGVQRCAFAILFHRPCPGCGMTRAIDLLLSGNVAASFHLHPLAIPMLVAGGTFALSTVWTTFVFGVPLVHKSALGKLALGLLAVTYAACLILWIARLFGAFGGPVSVG